MSKEENKKQNLWTDEIKKREDFGISSKNFYPTFGPVCKISQIKSKPDFMHFSSIVDRLTNNVTLKDSFEKYKQYTFKQLEESGGILKLSEICGFVHVIIKKQIEYNDKRIGICRRKKEMINFCYPSKVYEMFKENSRCMAVVYTYEQPLTRQVIIGKL